MPIFKLYNNCTFKIIEVFSFPYELKKDSDGPASIMLPQPSSVLSLLESYSAWIGLPLTYSIKSEMIVDMSSIVGFCAYALSLDAFDFVQRVVPEDMGEGVIVVVLRLLSAVCIEICVFGYGIPEFIGLASVNIDFDIACSEVGLFDVRTFLDLYLEGINYLGKGHEDEVVFRIIFFQVQALQIAKVPSGFGFIKFRLDYFLQGGEPIVVGSDEAAGGEGDYADQYQNSFAHQLIIISTQIRKDRTNQGLLTVWREGGSSPLKDDFLSQIPYRDLAVPYFKAVLQITYQSNTQVNGYDESPNCFHTKFGILAASGQLKGANQCIPSLAL